MYANSTLLYFYQVENRQAYLQKRRVKPDTYCHRDISLNDLFKQSKSEQPFHFLTPAMRVTVRSLSGKTRNEINFLKK